MKLGNTYGKAPLLDATKKEYLDYLKLAEKNLKTGSIVVAYMLAYSKKTCFGY
jgi:predicted O-methyltransferase YrrM